MAVTYGGSLTLGQAIPMALTATAQLDSAVAVSLPDIQARVTGLLALSIAPPPSLADLIASVQALLASLQTLLAVPVPDVSATLSALVELQAIAAQLSASLAFSVSFGGLLGTPGIHFYAYAGAANAFGTQMGGFLSGGLPGGAGPTEQIAGVTLLANDGGAIAALESVFGP